MKRPSPKTKAAMVADYAAGMSSEAVAKKYGTSSSSVLRYVAAAGCGRTLEEAKARQRELREAAKAAEERRQRDVREYLANKFEEEITLSGGRWVICPRRRIQVWEAW